VRLRLRLRRRRDEGGAYGTNSGGKEKKSPNTVRRSLETGVKGGGYVAEAAIFRQWKEEEEEGKKIKQNT
jgi:hypothetical protein